jgi:ribosome-binding factor A
MPTSERTARVSEVIRRELTTLMSRCHALEGLLITVIDVETAPDLRQAFVYLSVLQQETSNQEVLRLMNKHRAEWQEKIGHRIATKFTPRLVFQINGALERGDRVTELLNKIAEDKATLRATEPDPSLANNEEDSFSKDR